MVVAAVAFTPGVYGTHEFSLAQVYPLFIFLLFITCLFKYSLEEKLCDAFPASESQLDVVLGQYCVVCCCVKMSTDSYFGGNTSSVDAFSLAANRISGESEISTIKCTKSDSASTLWCQFARSFCHCLLACCNCHNEKHLKTGVFQFRPNLVFRITLNFTRLTNIFDFDY